MYVHVCMYDVSAVSESILMEGPIRKYSIFVLESADKFKDSFFNQGIPTDRLYETYTGIGKIVAIQKYVWLNKCN